MHTMHMGALSTHAKQLLLVSAILALSAGVYVVQVLNREPLQTIRVVRGDLSQEVSLTGKAKAVQEVDLAFQAGGTIRVVQARVGSKVVVGDVLAQLDEDEMRANLAQAEASRDAEAAKLRDLQNGAKPEDLAVLEAKVASADSSRVDAVRKLANANRDAYTLADDAVHNKADQFLDNARSAPSLRIAPPDSQLIFRIESDRLALETLFTKWNNLNNATIGEDEADTVIAYLRSIQSYLASLSQAANSPNVSSDLSSATLASYRTDLSTARTQVDTAITQLQSALSALRTAEADLAIARRTLDSEKAGSTVLTIEAQAARVKQYEAQVASLAAQLSKTNLLSPITGIVTSQNAKVGQVANAGSPLVSVISDADLEIEAYVPEISIGKVDIGNRARIVFDAFPDQEYEGTVAAIDPAETIIDGVTNFKLTIALAQKDSRLRRGLTADVTIVRSAKESVLVIPEYAIQTEGGTSYVRVVRAGKPVAVAVTTGMRGTNGFIEIVSGINEGDEVVIAATEE